MILFCGNEKCRGYTADELKKKVKAAKTLEEALEGVSWVQECVPETLQFKKDAWSQIDTVLQKFQSQGKSIDVKNIFL